MSYSTRFVVKALALLIGSALLAVVSGIVFVLILADLLRWLIQAVA